MNSTTYKPYLPVRKKEVEHISLLLDSPPQCVLPSIFIHGHTSCGKSTVMTHVMETKGLPHVTVNCIECYSEALLYQEVLKGLSSDDDYTKCDGPNTFIQKFKTAFRRNYDNKTFYIIFDKAERLRDLDERNLPCLLRLRDLTSCSVSVIFMSCLPWDKFYNGAIGMCHPYLLHFPDYTKNEIVDVLCHQAPVDCNPDFYRQYITMILGVFLSACRDIRELRHLADLNFELYCEPIKKELATEKDTHRLWKHIEPYLRKAVDTLYLREVSSDEWMHQSSEILERVKFNTDQPELPYYAKFLLIAAYIASYNLSSTDRRFFVKNAGKMKRTAKSMKRSDKKNCHLRGPHSFPLDRLMAIFYSIIDEKVLPTINLFSQITTLVTLRLMMQIGHEDQIDSPKYKCTVSLDSIISIAKTVDFDVTRYLYDFI